MGLPSPKLLVSRNVTSSHGNEEDDEDYNNNNTGLTTAFMTR